MYDVFRKVPVLARGAQMYIPHHIQGVLGENVNILGGHNIGHSEQKIIYVHASYSERFPS
jgi:hypothetical protein